MDSLQFGALLYLLQFGKVLLSWTFFPLLQFAHSNLLVLFFPLAKFHFSSPDCRENRERLQLINNNNSDFAILRLGQNSKRVYFLSCKSYHLILVNQSSILLFLGLLSRVIYIWIAKHILSFYQFQRDIFETSLLRHSLCQTPSPPETK